MDTGRYRALVIQDPNDKQGLKGFVKFAPRGLGHLYG